MSETIAVGPGTRPAPGPRRTAALVDRLRGGQAWVLVAVVLIGVALLEPSLMTAANGQAVLSDAAVLGLLTIGQTVVILCGGIDLSVAANVRFASLLGASYMGSPGSSLVVGILIVLGISVGIGLLNGLLIGRLAMPAFITTLGMMLLLDGVTLTISSSATGAAPESLITFYTDKLLGVPLPAVLLIVAAVLVAAALRFTVWGRSVYAVGGDPVLAEHAGLRVGRTQVSVYVVSGLLAGVAAVVLLSRAGVGDPTALQGFELQSVTAAVVGAVSLAGGRGTVWGALGGAAFLVTATTVLSLLGVETRYLVLAQGLLILFALGSYRSRSASPAAP